LKYFFQYSSFFILGTRASDESVTWYVIKTKLGSMEAIENGEGIDQEFPVGATMNRLKRMKFVMHQIPPHEFVGEDEERKSYPPEVYMANFVKLADDILKAFDTLSD
jgi:hypothetical protein